MQVIDPIEQALLLRSREESGADRFDEVWDGVYLVAPLPDIVHQVLMNGFAYAFTSTVVLNGLGQVYPGVNVSDRDDDWEHNYRGPDVVVILSRSKAILRPTHMVGRPDFVVEIISQYDRSRKKLDFDATVGVRELLMVDRFPWSIELYRLVEGKLTLVGKSTLKDRLVLISDVLPLTFQLVPGEDRPMISVAHRDGHQRWLA